MIGGVGTFIRVERQIRQGTVRVHFPKKKAIFHVSNAFHFSCEGHFYEKSRRADAPSNPPPTALPPLGMIVA